MSDPLSPVHRLIVALSGILLLLLAHDTGSLSDASQSPNPPGEGTVLRRSRPLMGTTAELSVWVGTGAEAGRVRSAMDEVIDELTALERRISSWQAGSETSALEELAGHHPRRIGPDLRDLLEQARHWWRITEGAFDPTGGPLFDLWRECLASGRRPSSETIHDRLRLVGMDALKVQGDEAFLTRRGMKLSLGAIGKGFATDMAARSLRSRGLENFVVSAGGDLVLAGSRGPAAWRTGLRHPRRRDLLAVCEITGRGIASSGDYEQGAIVGGERVSHIVDPRTGLPASGPVGVTVIAPTGTAADALATALSVMEPEAGLRLVETLPGTEAVLVEKDGSVRLSSGLRMRGGRLQLLTRERET